ncbi:MAG: hypothetical protein H6712_34280 [Myxococcales bacterium]|nr:hypothetical protein [Myxococcales bacterium]MCB9718963.1 hypothetical protein [Myxococcales bacterium]
MSNSPWVGIWRNEALGAELLLAGDGRFGFRGPNGAAHGRYRIDSGGLWLVDAGGTTWAYRVVALDAQSLQLVDPFGVPLRYERAQPPSLASGAVLAEADGLCLTEGEVEVGLALVRLLIDAEPTPDERRELTQASVDDFQRDPAGFMGQVHQLHGSLEQVRALHGATELGLARQGILAAVVSAIQGVPETERPRFVQVVLRHVRVLAFDPAAQLVLSDRDVAGLLRYAAFVRELAGQPALEVDDDQRRALEQELASSFPAMPLERKQQLCSCGLLWRLVDANWQRFDEAQRQALRDEVRAHAATADAAEGPAVAPLPPAEPVVAPLPSAEAPATPARGSSGIDPATWSILMDVSLNTHATALNIIENIGGTGNYWEVV